MCIICLSRSSVLWSNWCPQFNLYLQIISRTHVHLRLQWASGLEGLLPRLPDKYNNRTERYNLNALQLKSEDNHSDRVYWGISPFIQRRMLLLYFYDLSTNQKFQFEKNIFKPERSWWSWCYSNENYCRY